MMCGNWNPERLNRFLPLSHRAEGTCGLEDIENISLRSLAGCYDGVIINFSLFWWDSSPGSRRCKGVDTHCLSRCRILWADAKCWLRHLFPPLMLAVSSWWTRAACAFLIPWTSVVYFIWYLSPLLRVSCPTARVFVVNLLALNSSFSSTLWLLLSSNSFSSSLEALQSPCQGACEDLYQWSVLEVSQLTVSLSLLQVLGHILIKTASSQKPLGVEILPNKAVTEAFYLRLLPYCLLRC